MVSVLKIAKRLFFQINAILSVTLTHIFSNKFNYEKETKKLCINSLLMIPSSASALLHLLVYSSRAQNNFVIFKEMEDDI